MSHTMQEPPVATVLQPMIGLEEEEEMDRLFKEYRQELKEDLLSDEIVYGALEGVTNTWKDNIYKDWIPVQNGGHICTTQKSPHQHDEQQEVNDNYCVLENVVFTLYKMKSNGGIHACIKDYCKLQHQQDKTIKLFTELYVCTYSGKSHYCGDYCSLCVCSTGPRRDIEEKTLHGNNKSALFNKDGTLTCPLTGTCFQQQNMISKIHVEQSGLYDFEQKRKEFQELNNILNDTSVSNGKFKRAMNQITGRASSSPHGNNLKLASGGLFFRKKSNKDEPDTYDMDRLMTSVREILSSKSRTEINIKKVKRIQGQPMKMYYLTIAALKIADMLAPSRLEQYEENNERKIQKLVKPFTSYVNKCYSRNEIPNVCELSEIMRNEEKTLYIPPRIKLPTSFLTEFVIDYAKLCVSAWYAIIITVTPETNLDSLGNEIKSKPLKSVSPSIIKSYVDEVYKQKENKMNLENIISNSCNFKFTEFIDAYISLIKSGLNVMIPSGEVVVVYSKDDFIDMIPNIEEEERKKGDYSTRHRRKLIASMKKKIQNAVVDTILKDNIHYNKLSPHHYNFESLDDQFFVEIKEWQKIKRKNKHPHKKRKTKAEIPSPSTNSQEGDGGKKEQPTNQEKKKNPF